tara:strand:+ start:35698 stop:36531 length:834 start_codon:yes stop_codon:yes gene_type:complete
MINTNQPLFDQTDIYRSLLDQGFVSVPFSIDPKCIQEAMDAFMRFLQEPDHIKEEIDFSIAPLHRRGDVGYKHRKANEHIYNDDKEFFHFHPALMPRYENFINQNPVVKSFIQKAYPIWQLAFETVRQILLSLEPISPNITNNVFDTDEVHFSLRFLKYQWQKSGRYLAKPHYDAGSFTLAIAESCPGLRIGTAPDNLNLVKHEAQTAIFFLSSNFEKVMCHNELKPAWHDVVQLDEAIIGEPFARWALVAFIDGHNIEALPRSETHKWLVQSGGRV